MSTLFVGIDVSSKTNAVYAIDFEENKYISSSFGNNQPGADPLVNRITECMQKHKSLDTILIVLESTSVYSVHISNLDKCIYKPLNVSLASSFNCIQSYQKEIKLIEQTIEKCTRE